MQGEQVAHVEKTKDAHGTEVVHKTLELAKPGTLTKDEYDALVADLVAYLVYMGEPVAETRKQTRHLRPDRAGRPVRSFVCA